MAGIGDITGTLEKGKCADMIVTEKNPLEDIRALGQVEMVVARGNRIENLEVYKREWKQYTEKISGLFDGEEGQEEKMRGNGDEIDEEIYKGV